MLPSVYCVTTEISEMYGIYDHSYNSKCDWRRTNWTKADQVDSMLKLQLFLNTKQITLILKRMRQQQLNMIQILLRSRVTTHVFCQKKKNTMAVNNRYKHV
ncbi:hypothetical protein EVAR_80274_1 [Eumeta japonica]|uniref:Uncharacterized protein n=1 Tax=Eumeta variegata TaxID=151549 RepID=A0A4C1UC02_EUMVA|nr:hypothetical protein EVAR_80274_1 [Eumeta japonica]